MTLYRKLEILTADRGMRVSDLGNAIGVPMTYATYTGWKRGARPKPDTLKKIADFLDVTVDWLSDDSLDFSRPEPAKEEDPLLGELISLWNKMDTIQRAKVLAYAASL